MSGSSPAVLPPAPPPQQQQQITAAQAQLSDAIRELIKQQQEITAAQAQLSDAIRQLIRQQQQQEITTAARSRSDKLRGWLLVVATLTASITYSAALNPPGGVWQADDPAKGYIAGTPVLFDKFLDRYLAFHCFNVVSFTSSLCIIALCSIPSSYNRILRTSVSIFVTVDILALAGAFIAGSSTTPKASFDLIMVLAAMAYVVVVIFIGRKIS